MNILKFLFKKRKNNIDIIKFGDNILVPGKDYFKDENDIKLLLDYKKYYEDELVKRKAMTTLSFESNKLKKRMVMDTDLLLRIVMENDDFYLFAPEELMVQSAKLKMYYSEIYALEKETILRLVALKEIENKGVLKCNKKVLEEEINSLSIILEMFSYRKGAINIELKNYFDMLSTRDLSKEDVSVLDKRLVKLLFITEGIVDKVELDKYKDIRIKIAILERECERYAYSNKEEAKRISGYYTLSDENKILLFYEYGKDCFDENFVKKFYLYKFNMLTRDNVFDDIPISKDDYGYSYYLDIISNKIDNLQNLCYFSRLVSDGVDISYLLEDAKRYLKNEYGEFDCDEILANKLKLSFILSLNHVSLNDFFSKNIICLNEENEFAKIKNKYSYGIMWHVCVPIGSLFELFCDNLDHPLCSFYKLNRINTDLLIPEGVKDVIFDMLPSEYFIRKSQDIGVFMGNYDIYWLPRSLKSARGSIPVDNCVYYALYLNDGLEYVDSEVFNAFNVLVSIPTSVKEIVGNENFYQGIIEFRDFKNSEIINNKERFVDFIGKISFEELRFTSDDLDEAIIIYSELCEKPGRWFSHKFSIDRSLGSLNRYEVYLKIRDILFEKTGYDIFNKEEKIKRK